MREKTGVIEQERQIDVVGSFDVIVAGGGIAGVAAAVAAAREGVSVCLLEKTCAPGGLATLGNVIVWLPLCDGMGRQVIGGLPEELLKLSVADLVHDNLSACFCGIPECWLEGGDVEERKKNRYRVEFNPASYLLALEKLLVDADVQILYDTRVCAVQKQGARISHLIIENKSGRTALECGVVIDATGDADVCFMAGEKTESLDSNVLCGWFYVLDNDGLHLKHLSNTYSPLAEKEGAKGPFFRGDNAEDVTAHILGTRELMRNKLAEIRIKSPVADIQVVMPPSIPCFRMTRRLVSSFSPGVDDVHKLFDDTIGLTGDWRKSGPVYAVPMRSLAGVKNRNLLAAGRCISVDKTLWDVTRAIPTCALTGAAAGIGAVLAVHEKDGDVQALPVSGLQQILKERGFILDPA